MLSLYSRRYRQLINGMSLSLVLSAAMAPGIRADDGQFAVQEEGGRVRLQFKDQAWLPVLNWLAEESKLSLDWQSLPEGNLSLATQRSYSLDEARDLLNMHLLARGFTLVRHGEILRLLPLKDLDPTMLPRVEAEKLDQRDAHEFARTSFELDWLVAEQAAKELSPLLSPHGKIMPMTATNRLEVIDAVVNLREIDSLLQREQSSLGRKRLVVEFKLEHTRAEDVAEKLRELLGSESSRRMRTSDRMRMNVERNRMKTELIKELGKDAKEWMEDDYPVNLVVNQDENSILVNAPADKVELIRQAVEAIDKPSEKTRPVWEAISRIKTYKVTGIDADAFRDILDELREQGTLHRNSRFEVDDDSGSIIVYGEPEDQLIVANMVNQFRPEPRQADVIQLTHLEPGYAAQAVQLMLKSPENDDEGRYWWRRRGNSDSDSNKLRIEPDPANSRLLVWGTKEEISEIKVLLAKLGEFGEPSLGGSKLRVIDAPATDVDSLEEKIRQLWPRISTRPLEFKKRTDVSARPDDHSKEPAPSEDRIRRAGDRSDDENQDDAEELRVAERNQAAVVRSHRREWERALASLPSLRATAGLRFASSSGAVEAEPALESDAEAPGVTVTEGTNGQLIITSEDPAAAEQMEQLLREVLPSKPGYEVFYLENASALSIQFQLEEFFINEGSMTSSWSGESSAARSPLDTKKSMTFVSDTSTNTLLVQNATPQQLRQIENLIELYDRPERVDKEIAREIHVYHVQHGDALALANTVKDVYRDLLSTRDRAFDRERENREGERRDGRWIGSIQYSSTRKELPYQGLLSVGVDQAANTLILSAPRYFMEEVIELVRKLDESAAATTVQVVPINGVSSNLLRQALGNVLDSQTSGQSRSSASSRDGSSRDTDQRRQDYSSRNSRENDSGERRRRN